jgi:2-succinyl-6-hydroxy-2,4-cyclohexadiene-1-carboxylate synthase
VPETLVLLHGFGGTRHAWDSVVAQLDPQRYRPLALDLPGHGDAKSHAGSITLESCVQAVLLQSPDRFGLCGYSMGGRIALRLALAAPERISRLVLVSSTAGIEDAYERAQRRARDRALAEELERAPFEQFFEKWRDQPLFRDDPPEVRARAREDQRRNDPRALAAVICGVGAGEMKPLWSRLGEMRVPTTILVGQRDPKFLALGARMHELMPDSELRVVPGGHDLPRESAEQVARALNTI